MSLFVLTILIIEIMDNAVKDMTGYDAKLTIVHAAQLDPSQFASCVTKFTTTTTAINSIAKDILPTIL